MLRYFLLFTFAFLYATKANEYDYPTLAHCDRRIVTAIERYRDVVGTPHHVLKRFQEFNNATVLMTSYDYNINDKKCAYVTTHGNYMNATLISKNENTPDVVLPYRVVEGKNGHLRGTPLYSDAPEHQWNWYSIYIKNGIGVFYVCSDLEGSTQPPLATILIKQTPFLTREPLSMVITSLNAFLDELGFRLNHKYDECVFGDSKHMPTSPFGGASSGQRGLLSG